jgi:carbon storage regulator CsrA
MLMISRKAGERIRIGEAVVLVQRIGRNRVSLRIDAPEEMKIKRMELETKGAEFQPIRGAKPAA